MLSQYGGMLSQIACLCITMLGVSRLCLNGNLQLVLSCARRARPSSTSPYWASSRFCGGRYPPYYVLYRQNCVTRLLLFISFILVSVTDGDNIAHSLGRKPKVGLPASHFPYDIKNKNRVSFFFCNIILFVNSWADCSNPIEDSICLIFCDPLEISLVNTQQALDP